MTDDLSTRLLAELQRREDEANAWEHDNPDEGGYYACPAARTEPLGDLPFGEDECTCGLAARRADVLRLCQAHREIVELHAPIPEDPNRDPDGMTICREDCENYPCRTTLILASAYGIQEDQCT